MSMIKIDEALDQSPEKDPDIKYSKGVIKNLQVAPTPHTKSVQQKRHSNVRSRLHGSKQSKKSDNRQEVA